MVGHGMHGTCRPGKTSAVYFYLEEPGIPYEAVRVNLAAGEQHKPELRALNPIGKVPALRLQRLPNVMSYLRRLAERPAFQETIPVAA